VVSGLWLLALLGCWTHSSRPKQVFPWADTGGYYTYNLTLEGAPWREVVSLEEPRQVAHLFFPNLSTKPSARTTPAYFSYRDADSFEGRLDGAIAAYNGSQERYPDLAHHRYERRVIGGHTLVIAVETMGPDGVWIPSTHTLDAVLSFEAVQGECEAIVAQLRREASIASRHLDASQGAGGPFIDGGRDGGLYYFDLSEVRCSLEGSKSAREHLLGILDQLEAQTGEPWCYSERWDRLEYPWATCRQSPDGEYAGNEAGGCNHRSFSVRPLTWYEWAWDSSQKGRFKRGEYEQMEGFRVPRDPARPPPPRPSFLPDVGLPDEVKEAEE